MLDGEYSTRFYCFDTAHIQEILACMEDSDRFILWSVKERLIKELKQELALRVKTISEEKLHSIKIHCGTVYVTPFDHEIRKYELNKDNPAHCLHLGTYYGEKVNIAIYPDSVSILPDGKDGFRIPSKLEFRVKDGVEG